MIFQLTLLHFVINVMLLIIIMMIDINAMMKYFKKFVEVNYYFPTLAFFLFYDYHI